MSSSAGREKSSEGTDKKMGGQSRKSKPTQTYRQGGSSGRLPPGDAARVKLGSAWAAGLRPASLLSEFKGIIKALREFREEIGGNYLLDKAEAQQGK